VLSLSDVINRNGVGSTMMRAAAVAAAGAGAGAGAGTGAGRMINARICAWLMAMDSIENVSLFLCV
jgi:hypothetical protein